MEIKSHFSCSLDHEIPGRRNQGPRTCSLSSPSNIFIINQRGLYKSDYLSRGPTPNLLSLCSEREWCSMKDDGHWVLGHVHSPESGRRCRFGATLGKCALMQFYVIFKWRSMFVFHTEASCQEGRQAALCAVLMTKQKGRSSARRPRGENVKAFS